MQVPYIIRKPQSKGKVSNNEIMSGLLYYRN